MYNVKPTRKGCKRHLKGFYKYVGNKRKTKERVSPLLNIESNLVTNNAEKAVVLNVFFTSVFMNKVSYPVMSTPDTKDREEDSLQ